MGFLSRPTAGHPLEAESKTQAAAHIFPKRRELPLDTGILHNFDQHDADNEILTGRPAIPHFSDQHFRFGFYINARRNSHRNGEI
jgi:hypothetical protein